MPNKANKRILVIAYNYPPQNTSGAVRPSRFVKYLPCYGYEAEVVCVTSDSVAAIDQVHRVPAPGRAPLRLRVAQLRHEWFQSLVSPHNERLAWVPHAVAKCTDLLSRKPVTAVLSTSPPVATHVAAQRLKQRFHIKWIADFRDPLLGNPFRVSKRAAIYYWYQERNILEHADLVIANTEPFAEVLRTRHPVWASKIVCIPNGYDPGEVLRPASIPARSHRVLAHFGTLYGGRHPERLLSSMERLIAKGVLDPSTIRVELIGRIDPLNISMDRPPFTSLRERGCLSYDGVQMPREQARERMTDADYLLLLDINEKELSFQVPAKLYDYLQVGRPILAFTNTGSPTAEILALSGVPHTCIYTTDSAERMDSALLRFLELPSEPANCSSAFRERYDVSLQTRRLAEILDQLQGS